MRQVRITFTIRYLRLEYDITVGRGTLDRAWQRDAEGGTPIFAGALNLDRALMHFHQMANDCETQTQSTVLPGRAAVRLAKAIENVRHKVGLDTNAGVGNFDVRTTSALFEPD